VMSGLEVERFGVGGNVVLLDLLIEDVAVLGRHLVTDEGPERHFASFWSDLCALTAQAEAATAFVADHIEREVDGAPEEGDAAVAKLLYSEAYNKIARYGARVAAEHAVPDLDEVRQAAVRLQDAWLWSRALTISGGSSEILRNIAAKRRLHLPPD